MVKDPPAKQEMKVQSLVQEDLWRKKRQPTLMFMPGRSHGQRSLVGYMGSQELDMTELLNNKLELIRRVK